MARRARRPSTKPVPPAQDAKELAVNAPPAPSERARTGSTATLSRFGAPGAPFDPRNPLRMGFLGAAGVLLALLLAYSLVQVRSVLVLLLISAFLAVGLNPIVEVLQGRGLSRARAVLVISLGFLLVLGGLLSAVIPPITTELPLLIQQVPEWAQRLQEENTAFARLDETYDVVGRLEAAVSGGLGASLFGGVLGAGAAVLGALVSALTVLVLTLYFLANYPRIKESAYRLVPASRRPRTRLMSDEILRRVGGYVLGALTVAAAAGVSSFLFLLVADVPYPVALAAVVAVFALIPLVGSTLGGVVVTAAAFFVSVPVGVAAIVFYLLYQQFENYFLVPRIMKRAVDVSPLVTIVAALVGGTLMGVLGALLAVPAAAAVQLVGREVVVPRQDAS